MSVCDITIIKKRVVGALMANRLAPYSGVVGTGSSANSRYQSDQEITDTILEADALIILARISNPGDEYRPQFMIASGALASGDFITPHVGAQGDIDIAIGSTYSQARYFQSKAQAIEVKNNPTLYPVAQRYAIIEDGRITHNGDNAKVYYPSFTKTTVCQAPQVDELAEIMGTIGMLPKDGAVTPELYSMGANYFAMYLQRLAGATVDLPETEQVERQLAA